MNLIVMKFGGTSVADPARIARAAEKVVREVERGNKVAVVVSAMAGVTNQLVSYCRELNPDYDEGEYDAVVSSGEQVTAGLMAIALHKRGMKARSWQGWQVQILSTQAHGRARIMDVDASVLMNSFERNEIPVVAGFQGVSEEGRITTLGRGGSDTSAVALAAALKADRCDIYTDVDGVYTTDPRIVKQARKLNVVSYEEMLEMASVGAKVLQIRSVELAMKTGMQLQVLSSMDDAIGSDLPGTVLMKEEDMLEHHVISGVTLSRDEAKLTLIGVEDKPGIAASVFGALAEAGINVDMIVQNTSPDGKVTDMTFTVPRGDMAKAVKAVAVIKAKELRTDDKVAKVSVIGIGMRAHPEIAKTMFATLADNGINIEVISTSEIKISVLIDENKAEAAVKALHGAFGLDRL